MRKYITEKVGVLEFFQTIIAIVTLVLGFYAFIHDRTWDQKVEADGINTCVEMNQKIAENNKSALLQFECGVRNFTMKSCTEKVDKNYLKWQEPFKWKTLEKPFIMKRLRRGLSGEFTFIIMLSIITTFLIGHLILANCLKNIALRTKWNAALQGIILFTCGFSAMLLATAISTINENYQNLSDVIPPCSLLKICNRNSVSKDDLSAESKAALDYFLQSFSACQDTKIKESTTFLLVLIILMCVLIILWAMDLTTLYEEELDQEREASLDRKYEIAQFLDDQTVDFDRGGEDTTNVASKASVLENETKS